MGQNLSEDFVTGVVVSFFLGCCLDKFRTGRTFSSGRPNVSFQQTIFTQHLEIIGKKRGQKIGLETEK